MARKIEITFVKTYATPANAEKAIEKFPSIAEDAELRYAIMPVEVDGKIRYGVMFIGMNALQNGVQFSGFNVVA